MNFRGLSVWLQPTSETRSALSNIISELSSRFSAPLFAPHLSLVAGLENVPLNEMAKKVEIVAEGMEPFGLTINEIEPNPNPIVYYQGDTLRAVKCIVSTSPVWANAREHASRLFDLPLEDWKPHLSVMYMHEQNPLWGTISQRLAREYGTINAHLAFKSLSIADTSGSPEQWRVLRTIPFGPKTGSTQEAN
eukprot:gnl/Trimastix_PCT/3587.p1 GENE.gnl/Trimastix_PCT/3587~~gnl/Trimastix_PCT/3587.p1  ORF type:complete len:192 (+),score=15.47 gnl/Trimastix_PCT/3587:80-655(+)